MFDGDFFVFLGSVSPPIISYCLHNILVGTYRTKLRLDKEVGGAGVRANRAWVPKSRLMHDEFDRATSYHFCLMKSMQRRPDCLDTPVSVFLICISSAAAASRNVVSEMINDCMQSGY